MKVVRLPNNLSAPMPVLPSVPQDVAEVYAKAQGVMRQSKALGYCDQYLPLMQLVENAKVLGGAHVAPARDACLAIIAAEEADLVRMVFHRRAAPDTPTYQEGLVQRQVATLQLHQAHAATALAMTRPRMSLAEQIAAMEARGLRFATDGDALRVVGPPGEMNDADRRLIREQKAAIIAHINDQVEVF